MNFLNKIEKIAYLFEKLAEVKSLKRILGLLNIKSDDDYINEWIISNNFIGRLEDLPNPVIIRNKIDPGIFVVTIRDEAWHRNDKVIISKQQLGDEQLENYKLKERKLIKGIGKIPDLYYYSVKNVEVSFENFEAFGKEALNNYFIVEVLKSFPSFRGKNNRDYNQFIIDNISKINNLKSMFKERPTFLGRQTDSTVFTMSDDLVIKFFINKYLYDKMKESYDFLFEQPAMGKEELPIYDIGQLGIFNDTPIYYLIMKKVKIIPRHERHYFETIANNVVYEINDNKDYYTYLTELCREKKYNRAMQEIEKASIDIAENIREDQDPNIIKALIYFKKLGLTEKWLEKFIKHFLSKVITEKYDLHAGNIGITQQKELQYFDPAWEGQQEEPQV
jgi:hypothetical protein